MTGEALRALLAGVVGDAHVLTEPEMTSAYTNDLSGRWVGTTRAVARPANVHEVAEVVSLCARERIPLVPQGGNTGLVGGGVPGDGEIVVSLTRLTALEPVDPVGCDIVAEAGATLERVQRHARDAGFEFGIDIAARDSATIGGMAATNAGGAMAYRYGTMAGRVAGMEMVLPDGQIVERMRGLRKDTAGFRLPELVVGSEGTLAIITRLRLRLGAPSPNRIAALCGLPAMGAAVDLFESLQRGLPTLEAIDFFDDAGMRLVQDRLGVSAPLERRHPVYVIIGCAGDGDLLSPLAQALDRFDPNLEVVAADSTAERARLWRPREALNETVNAAGVPLKIDVGVPPRQVSSFTEDTAALVAHRWSEVTLIVWGHLGDGNVHVNLVGVEESRRHELEDAIVRLAAAHGGTFSAEHGVGRAKVQWLPLIRDPAEVRLMRDVKQAFDPLGIMNPGCVLPRTAAA